MLIIGLVAWIARFLFFGYGNADAGIWMFYLAIILHGVCYDFFFVTGQIYTDQKAGDSIRSSAQGLISLATYGIGMSIGSYLSGFVKDWAKTPTGIDYTAFWMVPAVIAVVVLLLFVFLFTDKKTTQPTEGELVTDRCNNVLSLQSSVLCCAAMARYVPKQRNRGPKTED